MSILVGWICIEGSPWFLRKEPGLVRDFAERLRSKLATARSAAVVSDNEWEWYITLTLWSPLQVIRLLEDSSEQTAPQVALGRDLIKLVGRSWAVAEFYSRP